MTEYLKEALDRHLREVEEVEIEELLRMRYEKFRR
jgi:acetyl-CoA carboxylase alpha subunit